MPVTEDFDPAISPARRDGALTPDCTFVLGAQDPEMREIERVVASAGAFLNPGQQVVPVRAAAGPARKE